MQTTMRMFAVPNANIFRRRKDFPLHFGKKATGLILLTATVYIIGIRCYRKMKNPRLLLLCLCRSAVFAVSLFASLNFDLITQNVYSVILPQARRNACYSLFIIIKYLTRVPVAQNSFQK